LVNARFHRYLLPARVRVWLGAGRPATPYTSDTARAENANLKALVEKILWREQKGRNLP